MSEKEYFIVLPLLLYGLAITDLVNSWRSFIVKRGQYVPHVITSLLLLEVAFWNFFRLNEWVSEDVFSSYFSYFRVLFPPMIFIVVVAVFTPDSDEKDVKSYFLKYMPITYGGLAIFVASHFLFEHDKNVIPRVVMIGLLASAAIFRKEWMVYVVIAARVISWFFSEA